MTARMRTINEAINEIRQQDPRSAFTPTALRRMIRSGEIPSVSVGSKYLVNLDVLISYLNTSEVAKPAGGQPDEIGTVRKIPEKLHR